MRILREMETQFERHTHVRATWKERFFQGHMKVQWKECLVDDEEKHVLLHAVEIKVQFKETLGCWSGDMWAVNSDASARKNSALKFELQINYTKESTPVLMSGIWKESLNVPMKRSCWSQLLSPQVAKILMK